MSIVAIADFSLLVFATYLVYKIYKLVKFSDKPMLLSTISIALALLAFLIYSTLLIVQAELIANDLNPNEDNMPYLETADGTNLLRVIDSFKVMFTFCAFVFDLYKWCIFITATS